MTASRSPGKIYGFDALRAFSVSLVILSHIGLIEHATNPILARVFSVFNANYGVKTFFVLSGFLITTLLIKEYEAAGTVNVFNFMMRRVLRILPLYFLVLAVMSALIYAGAAQPSWSAMKYGAFFVFNFIPKALDVNYLSHLWSLAVEEQYYIVWPLAFSALYGIRGALIGFCLLIIAICYMAWGAPWPDHAAGYYTNRWTIPAIYPIAIGSLMALVIRNLRQFLWSEASLVVAGTLILLPLFRNGTATIEFLGTFGIALLIAWIYLNQHRASIQLMDWGIIGYIGTISYGLYMWQGILTGNGPYREAYYWPPPPYAGVLLTFLVAPLSFHFFEQPLSSLRKYFPPGRKMVDNQKLGVESRERGA